jgi:hypothetical protein
VRIADRDGGPPRPAGGGRDDRHRRHSCSLRLVTAQAQVSRAEAGQLVAARARVFLSATIDPAVLGPVEFSSSFRVTVSTEEVGRASPPLPPTRRQFGGSA